MRRSLPFAFALVAACAAPAALAGTAPSGPEFQVNTFTSYVQTFPAMSTDGAGRFVVVWRGDGQDGDLSGIFGQLLDASGGKLGSEFQVNAYTSDDQEQADVAMDPNGAFVVVWTDFTLDGGTPGVFGRIFDSSGAASGGEFQVNSYTTGIQDSPSVAVDPAGGFVVIWESYGQDGDGRGVFGRRFDVSGAALGAEFQVNLAWTGSQFGADVAFEPAGGFVVVWGTDVSGVFAQRFDTAGAREGMEFQVNTDTSSYPHLASVDFAQGGEMLVAWESDGPDGDGLGVFARAYDSLGSPLGQEFQVNTFTTSVQGYPAVAAVAPGEFVVSWDSYGQDADSFAAVARSVSADGTFAGGEFFLNASQPGPQQFAKIATDGQGTGLAVWATGFIDDIAGRRICGDGDQDQVCDADDIFITAPPDMGSLDCSDPAGFQPVFTWQTGVFDRFKVYMGSSPGFEKGTRITSGRKAITTGSWQPSRKKWKKACRKAVEGNPLSPVLYIRVWGKDREVSKKDPARTTESQTVQVEIDL